MRSAKRNLLLSSLKTADLLVVATAFVVSLLVSGHRVHADSLQGFLAVRISVANLTYGICFALLWHLLLKASGLYRGDRKTLLSTQWWEVLKAVAVGTAILAGSATLFDFSAVSREFLLSFFGCTVVGTIAARSILTALLGDNHPNGRSVRKLVIAGCGPRGARVGSEVHKRPELGYLLLGYLDDIPPPKNPLHGELDTLLGRPSEARTILEKLDVDEVVICLPIRSYYETISELIAVCSQLGLIVRVVADFFETSLVQTDGEPFRNVPMLTLPSHAPRPSSLALKRVLDVSGALFALVVLGPLLALIALAIKVDSRGPVLFIQDRVGLRRRLFKVWKFRTMSVDAEQRQAALESLNEVDGGAFKITKDPRVTRVGRVLRKLSLDELPQFWNVLSGDMSLVGPRPLPLRDVERFRRNWQKRRFSVKPGLTCLWQINGRHQIDFEHWMEMDLQYIDNWSLSLDLHILFKTVPAVLKGDGAS